MGVKSKIDKLLRWGKIWFAQFAAVKIPNARCEADTGRVLVIKSDAIGDFLIWLDSAKELKGLYKDKQIVLLCSSPCVDIAKSTGYFDEILTLDIRKFESNAAYRRERIQQFQGMSFDVLIQTAFSRTIHMDMLAAVIPAAQKAALVSDESRTNLSRYIVTKSNKKKLDSIYDKLIPVTDGWLMEVKRNGELIRGLGKSDFQSGMPVLKQYDAADGIIPKGDYFVIFPGASTPKKMWDIYNFAQIADYICEKTGWRAYACGSKEEQILYERLNRPQIADYFGKTTLMELAEVIRHAKLVISNDTSGIHFAAAVNTPSVCILGEYNYGRFLPYEYDRVYGSELNPMIVCHADMDCKRCAAGKMTAECNACMAATGRYLCVDKVTISQVKEAVDRIIGVYGV